MQTTTTTWSPSTVEVSPSVEVSNVNVLYRMPSEQINSLKELAVRRITGTKITFSDFYALNNVNVKIMPGEAVGLIGTNGAGKSTLLKVISQVQRPTKGRVIVRGKISPMIELGSGFHPELTGRENIFMNGAMLGHSHAEMEAKFDNIVNFSELDDFIDSPIRTYSSGMVARLGFAIAAEIDPEILIVDEVLAVGDENFQRKCMERMSSFTARGVTVLFVSHALEKVQELCPRAIWLDGGRIRYDGVSSKAVQYFREAMNSDEILSETRRRQVVSLGSSPRKAESFLEDTSSPQADALRSKAPAFTLVGLGFVVVLIGLFSHFVLNKSIYPHFSLAVAALAFILLAAGLIGLLRPSKPRHTNLVRPSQRSLKQSKSK